MQPKIKPITWARSVFSPSQIAMARRCFRRWLLRYIHGIKLTERSSRGKIFGVLIHNCLAVYLGGGRVTDASLETLSENDRKDVLRYFDDMAAERGRDKADAELAKMLREAPQRALAGLHLLPDASACRQRLVEVPFKLDTRPLHRFGAAIVFSDWSRLDLVVERIDGVWFLFDHKSTAGDAKTRDPWAYVPSVEELGQDEQLLLYAACVMQQTGARDLWCRWVYYCAGESFAPQAKAVDVYVTWDQVVERLQPIFDACDIMVTEIKRTLAVNQLPDVGSRPFPENVLEVDRPCEDYRGCGYKGEQCKPPMIPLDRLVRGKQQKDTTDMSVESRMAAMQAAGFQPTPAAAAVVNPVPAVAAPAIAAPPGYAPVTDSAGNVIGWTQVVAPAPIAPPVGAPALPAGDPVGELALPGTPVVATPSVDVAEPAPEKTSKRGRKPDDATLRVEADSPKDAAAGLNGVDNALDALRARARKLGAVIEVKIAFDGQA